MSNLKTIEYRDGALSFRIPSHWKEDYDENGSGEFYDRRDDERTFRLTLHKYEAESPKPLEHPRRTMEAIAKKYGGHVTELGNGYYFNSHERHYEEDGEALTNRFWILSRMISETGSHLASFSYTYPDSLSEEPETVDGIRMLEAIVREARFFDIVNPSGREQADEE